MPPPENAGSNQIMLAAQVGNTELGKLLISGKADVNAKDPVEQKTALIFAAEKGHIDFCKLLLAHKADARATDKVEKTAITYAIEKGNTALHKLLVDGNVEMSSDEQVFQKNAETPKKQQLSSSVRSGVLTAFDSPHETLEALNALEKKTPPPSELERLERQALLAPDGPIEASLFSHESSGVSHILLAEAGGGTAPNGGKKLTPAEEEMVKQVAQMATAAPPHQTVVPVAWYNSKKVQFLPWFGSACVMGLGFVWIFYRSLATKLYNRTPEEMAQIHQYDPLLSCFSLACSVFALVKQWIYSKNLERMEKRTYKITLGLREGYAEDARVFTLEEASAVIKEWIAKRYTVNMPVVVGHVAQVTLFYPVRNTSGGSSNQGHTVTEPSLVFEGELSPKYDRDRSHDEVWETLASLTWTLGKCLKQKRVYYSFKSEQRTMDIQ
eukprot:g60616.t1